MVRQTGCHQPAARSFQLPNEDNACVLLTAKDGAWAVTLVYCLHDGLTTVWRFPDGSANVYLMPHPSIGVSNRHHCNVEFHGTPTDRKTTVAEIARDGENHFSYNRGNLLVTCEISAPAMLSVYTLDGKQAMQRSVSL